jgi:hypothetical protein
MEENTLVSQSLDLTRRNNVTIDRKPKTERPGFRKVDNAEFLYFDLAPTFGVLNGSIQIELASRIMTPQDGSVDVEFLVTKHLRCTPTAAKSLKEALEKALQMLDQPQQTSAVVASKLN